MPLIPHSPEWLAHKAETARKNRAKRKAVPRTPEQKVVENAAARERRAERALTLPVGTGNTRAKATERFARAVETTEPVAPSDVKKSAFPTFGQLVKSDDSDTMKPTPTPKRSASSAAHRHYTGGAREGAGRKPEYVGQVMQTISFRGTPEQRDEFIAAGGGAWARAGLDARLKIKRDAAEKARVDRLMGRG